MTRIAKEKHEAWVASFDEPAKVRRLAGTIWRTGQTVDEWLRKVRAGNKWCTACREWHGLGEFYEDAKQPDGLHGPCRRAVLAKLARKREATRKRVEA